MRVLETHILEADRQIAVEIPLVVVLDNLDLVSIRRSADAIIWSFLKKLDASAESIIIIERAMRALEIEHLPDPRHKNDKNNES